MSRNSVWDWFIGKCSLCGFVGAVRLLTVYFRDEDQYGVTLGYVNKPCCVSCYCKQPSKARN